MSAGEAITLPPTTSAQTLLRLDEALAEHIDHDSDVVAANIDAHVRAVVREGIDAEFADDEVPEHREETFGDYVRFFARGLAVLLPILAILCTTIDGYRDAMDPYHEGSSYAAFAIQHTPTYWIAKQLSEPRSSNREVITCHEAAGVVHCSHFDPFDAQIEGEGGCVDLTTGGPCEVVPMPHIHVRAKKVSGA